MHPVSDRVRVLAVDDEPDMLFIISELLRGAFEVVTAGNGMDALDHIGETEPAKIAALAAAALALGAVHWLVRDQDRREQHHAGTAAGGR